MTYYRNKQKEWYTMQISTMETIGNKYLFEAEYTLIGLYFIMFLVYIYIEYGFSIWVNDGDTKHDNRNNMQAWNKAQHI